METDMRLDSVQKRLINIPLARYQAGPTPHVSAALVSKFLRFTFKEALPCRDPRLQVTLCAPPHPPLSVEIESSLEKACLTTVWLSL